jgi:competence protein ComEC
LIVTGLLLAMRAHRLRVLAVAGLVGALLVFVPTRFVTPGWPAVGWAMVSCDVGQGDAAVLATADPERAVLVDTGPDPGTVSACLDRLGVRRLALIVITHLHADHIGGLAGALRGEPSVRLRSGPGVALRGRLCRFVGSQQECMCRWWRSLQGSGCPGLV